MFLNKKKRNFLKKTILFLPIIFINKILFLSSKEKPFKKNDKLIWYLNKDD